MMEEVESDGTEGNLDYADHVSWDEDEQDIVDDQGIAQQQPQVDITFCVWAIVHTVKDQCNEPRIVIVNSDPGTWLSSFIQAWPNTLHLGRPTAVHLITPQPDGYRGPDGLPCIHVIVEQGLRSLRRAIFLSVTDRTETYPGVRKFAISSGEHVNLASVMRLLNVPSPWIARHRVQAQLQAVPIHARGVICPGGAHIHVQFDPSDSGNEFEHMSLMSSVSRHEESSNDSRANASDHRSECGSSDTSEMQGCQECPNCPNCQLFQTWYINHRSMMTCEESRMVTLCGQSRDWGNAIHEVWPEFEQTSIFAIHMVAPPPLQLTEEHVPLNIIVEQQMQPGRQTILLGQEVDSARPTAIAISIPKKLPTLMQSFEQPGFGMLHIALDTARW